MTRFFHPIPSHKIYVSFLSNLINVTFNVIINLKKMRFQSCYVRGTIVSCETNLRQSGGIGANRVKKSRLKKLQMTKFLSVDMSYI